MDPNTEFLGAADTMSQGPMMSHVSHHHFSAPHSHSNTGYNTPHGPVAQSGYNTPHGALGYSHPSTGLCKYNAISVRKPTCTCTCIYMYTPYVITPPLSLCVSSSSSLCSRSLPSYIHCTCTLSLTHQTHTHTHTTHHTLLQGTTLHTVG